RVRLEGGAQHGDPAAGQGPQVSAHQVDHVVPAAQVDGVHLVQERHGLSRAELGGARTARADVLGEAATPEADPGVEELAADPLVVADGGGELGDVRAGQLGDLGHGVDEGDLRRQEGVGSDLDQLGGGQVGDDDRCLVDLDGPRVDLTQGRLRVV